MRLVLASASPRRAELLTAAGFVFEIFPADVDERQRSGEPPADYVRRLATEKAARALEAFAAVDHIVVLGADTTVVADGDVLGKPADDAEAARMLEKLSGRSHEVMTGVCLRTPAAALAAVVTTTVWFNPLEPADVAWYVATGEGRDKAGAYAIQGRASRFIPKISGSYANVVGLPVATIFDLLQRLTPVPGITV